MGANFISAECFAAIARDISLAALAPEKWQGVLDCTRNVIGPVNLHFFGYDSTSSDTSFMIGAGYDPHFTRIYEAAYSDQNPWIEGFTAQPAGTIVPSQRMCAEADLLRTEFYHDWVVPQEDILLGGGAILANDDNRFFVIGGNIRRRDGWGLQHRWLSTLELMRPLLQQALATNRFLAGKAFEDHLHETNFSSPGAAILLVSQTGKIVHCNGPGSMMLAEGDVIGIDPGGRLSCSDDALQDRLSRLLREGAGARLQVTRLHDRFGRAHQVAGFMLDEEGLSKVRSACWHLAQYPLLALVIKRFAEPSAFARKVHRFGLTRAEAEMVEALQTGLTPREIAGKRGRSLVTIQNQIKAVMQKTGAHRQLEVLLIFSREEPDDA